MIWKSITHRIAMEKAHFALLVLIGLFLVVHTGCKTAGTSATNTAKPPTADSANSNAANANQTSNANAPKDGEATNSKPSGPAELVGMYESREVQDKGGVVTLITQLKTVWKFSSDGTYTRVSEVKGKPYHADSGRFRIQPPDKLVLTIQVTGLNIQRKIQNPPLSKTHTFSLSQDGDELRLTSEKGSVGIFRRVAKPKAQ